MLARIFRWIIRTAVNLFIEVRVTGGAPVKDGPLMVHANHPLSILDCFVLFTVYDRPFYVMAKATLFEGWFRSRLGRALNFIPINRKQDGGDMRANMEILDESAVIVSNGNALIGFPEGRSDGIRELNPTKNGLMRVGFGAAKRLNFEKSVLSQVCGLTYACFWHPWKSRVTVHIEDPIDYLDWKDEYQKDDRAAVRSVAAAITEKLKHAVVEIPATDSEIIEGIAAVYRNTALDDRSRFKLIKENLARHANSDPARRANLETRLDEYVKLAEKLHVKTGDERHAQNHRILLLAVSFIVYPGFLLHYPIIALTRAYQKLTTDGHIASRGFEQIRCGIQVAIGWYTLLMIGLITAGFFGLISWYIVPLAWLGYLASGLIANSYLRKANVLWMRLLRKPGYKRLEDLGFELHAELEELRNEVAGT